MRKIIALATVALLMMLTSSWAVDSAAKLAPGPVSVTGKLQTGVMAIGGETTGTLLSVSGQGTFELDVKENQDVEKSMASLNGKQVKVTGTLSVKEGVEVAERRIIKVDTLVASSATDEKK